ncbi:macrophage metalloelastase-like [Solea senegalensis]|uniref:Macrophage metalloelastase-like n=1 Tax=Solea senegalensis TaxID=28829 RepID=A0AAV6SFV9_SOLSE|nr:matrix metallopeptidase 30 [Solea senegalensis]KAG7516007.1 macrophage metalloelastase-like [Solea senegalensis]
MEGALAFQTVMIVVVAAFCGAVPITSPSQEELAKAQEYLSQFFSDVGVTAPKTVRRSSLDSFDDTLRRMQEFFGLDVTGHLDSGTMKVMSQPRCGFTDAARYSHFAGQPKWEKSVVTYRIVNYTPDLSHEEVDSAIAKALKIYSDVIPLTFKKIPSGTADIMISFKSGDHGDFAAFDGVSGVLAHAFSPGEGHGGDTHFDEDETWTLTSAGSNLFLVAAHEFGHAMGMAHSQVETALMYPLYTYENTDGYKLPDDDKQGVQAIYGIRPTTPPTEETTLQPTKRPEPKPEPEPDPEPTPDPEPLPDRCSRDLVFDAATSIGRGLYFFKDGYFWKKSSSWDGITMKQIQSVWPEISHVDAAYEYKNTVVVFEGDHYWRISGNAVLAGYPKPLRDFGFPPCVKKIDAAVHEPFTDKTLFFVKREIWRYNERRERMYSSYPRYIKVEVPGITRVDAVFENEGYLYFSYGSTQIEYDYTRRRTIRTLSNSDWMDCE